MINTIDIKDALSNIQLLESIGNCPTLIRDYKDYHGVSDDEDDIKYQESASVCILWSQVLY